MTRQEFEQKAADGTLSVADVLKNKEYATEEQLAICTGNTGAISKHIRITRDVYLLASEVSDLLSQFPLELETTAAADLWAIASGDADTMPDTLELVKDARERCNDIARRVTDLMAESGEMPPDMADALAVLSNTLNKLLDGFDRFNVEALDRKACNADCLAYANGTCEYINIANLSQPGKASGLKDKRDCPRYREQYPERV